MKTRGWKTYLPKGGSVAGPARTTTATGPSGRQSGLVRGTRVVSELGWRMVEKLAVGDRLLTFDHGLQTIEAIRRRRMHVGQSGSLADAGTLTVPAGALENRYDMRLSPDQGVMLEIDGGMNLEEDPFSVVPARALEGWRGIRRSQSEQVVELITLVFAQEEVIYADGGLLLHCREAAAPKPSGPTEAPYRVLELDSSRALIKWLDIDDRMHVTPGGYVFGATEFGLVA